MKKFLVACLGLAACAAAAFLPTSAYADGTGIYDESYRFSDTGFYVGVAGGGAWASSDWHSNGLPVTSISNSGGIVGGTVGFNFQNGRWLLGIETDLSTGLRLRTHESSAGFCTGGLGCVADVEWLGTVRGRLGYAHHRMLFYVTGGAAFARIDHSIPVAETNRQTITGWTVGGGLEAILIGNLSAKIEYLFVDLGETVACPDSNASCPASGTLADNRLNIVRAGLNYRF
jgi:outer membrane immunogenic protein